MEIETAEGARIAAPRSLRIGDTAPLFRARASHRGAKQVYYRLANDGVSVWVRSIEAIFGSGRNVVPVVSAVVAEKPKRRQKELGSAGAAAFAKVI